MQAIDRTRLATALGFAAVVVAVSTFANAAPREMEMRVPERCYFSAAVDFDAIRAEAPALVGFIKEAIGNGETNGVLRAGKAASALHSMDKVAAWLAEVKNECGVSPEDFHWAMFVAHNHHFWVRRDSLQTQLVWGAAISAERLDWKRIESYTSSKGLKWCSQLLPLFDYDYHVVSWFVDDGYLAGMFSFAVAGDGMVYPGTGVSMGWAYSTDEPCKAMLDVRPSRRGRLGKGEVARVVLTDLPAVPLFARGAMNIPPYGPMLSGIDECCLSLFLEGGRIGARLRVDFLDEAKAEVAKALYEVEKPDMKEKLDAFKVSFEGKTLAVDSGLIDARQFFVVHADMLVEMLETLAR